MNSSKHYLAGISAFVIWGFFPIPLRALQAFSAGDILYFRILFSLGVLALVLTTFKRSSLKTDLLKFRSLEKKARTQVVWLTLIGGVLLTVNWLTFIYIVNSINIKTASFTYLICPVITAILGYVMIREKMTPMQWIAVAMCALSCLMLGLNSVRELGYSVFTALTYALYLISQRKNQGFDRLIILGIQVLFAFVVMTVFVSYLVTEIPAESYFYYNILLIAVLFTVIPLFLNLFALNRINSATIGILMYLNPLINFTLAFIMFDESANALQWVGYSIILVALVLFNFQNSLTLPNRLFRKGERTA